MSQDKGAGKRQTNPSNDTYIQIWGEQWLAGQGTYAQELLRRQGSQRIARVCHSGGARRVKVGKSVAAGVAARMPGLPSPDAGV